MTSRGASDAAVHVTWAGALPGDRRVVFISRLGRVCSQGNKNLKLLDGREGTAGAFPSPGGNATLFTDIATASRCESAGAILQYVGLPVPGREETASGGQIIDPNE